MWLKVGKSQGVVPNTGGGWTWSCEDYNDIAGFAASGAGKAAAPVATAAAPAEDKPGERCMQLLGNLDLN